MRDSFWRPESSVMKCVVQVLVVVVVVVVVVVIIVVAGSGSEGSERVRESCQGTRRGA